MLINILIIESPHHLVEKYFMVNCKKALIRHLACRMYQLEIAS